MFEIREAKTVMLRSVTNRSETHGKDEVPAATWGMYLETDNFFLDNLLPGLRELLYQPVGGDKQESLPDTPPRTPKLRLHGLGDIPLDREFNGWTMEVEHGIDEAAPITFGKCKVDDFRVTAKQDSIVGVRFRVGTSDVDAHRLGLMGVKIGQKISVRFTPPAAIKEQSEVRAEKKAQKRQAKAEQEHGQKRVDDPTTTFMQQHGGGEPEKKDTTPPDGEDGHEGSNPDGGSREPVRGENWPFPKGAADGSSDMERSAKAMAEREQAELEAGMRDSIAKAKLKPKKVEGRRGRRAAVGVE